MRGATLREVSDRTVSGVKQTTPVSVTMIGPLAMLVLCWVAAVAVLAVMRGEYALAVGTSVGPALLLGGTAVLRHRCRGETARDQVAALR